MMNSLSYAFSWMKGRKTPFFLGILLQGIVSFLSMYVIADFIAGVTQSLTTRASDLLGFQIGKLVIGYLLVITIDFIGNMLIMEACLYATKELQSDIVRKILVSKVECLNYRNSDEVINAFTSDISSIFNNLANVVAIPVNILFAGGGGLIYALNIDPIIGFLIVAFGIFKVVYGILFSKKMKRINQEMLTKRADFTASLKQLLDNPTHIRMFDMEEILKDRYLLVVDGMKKSNIHYGDISGLLGAVNNVVSEVFIRMLMFDLTSSVLAGDYGLADMMKQKEIASNALWMFSISRILTDAQIILVSTERVIDFIGYLEEEESGSHMGDNASYGNSNAFEFKRVHFGYGDKLILNGFGADIPKGSITILSGKSGSGKTSLLRLCQGIYLPQKGSISVFGREIGEWNLRSLRNKMAYVPQESFFFEGSVIANIAGEYENIEIDRVKMAAKDAQLYDVIMRLPDGFETHMTDNDSRFSGGEQKRLALARAFYKGTEVLLLDEMTAAVDRENEKIIYEILKNRRGRQTIIFATHRALARQIADHIIDF